jgi:hypothetical protein
MRTLRVVARVARASSTACGLALAAALCVCCGAAATREPGTSQAGPAGPLPAYEGRAADLFDDTIEPAAVGYGGIEPGGQRKDDALLRERTQTGDAVIRARVVTVTSEARGVDTGWLLGFRPVETVAGKKPPEGDFSFLVAGRSPASKIVRMLDEKLIGSTFVVFVRAFAPDTSQAADAAGPELHFHFAKDDKDELGAIHEASLLGEVR